MILYKYLPPGRFDVLKYKQVRFTEPALFNDPFESVIAISSFGPDSDVLPAILKRFDDIDPAEWDRDRLQDGIDLSLSEFKEYIHQNPERALEEFRKFEPSALDDQRKKLHDLINNAVGVLSLSEKHDSLLMWAHYADHHRGFVLGLDSNDAFFTPKTEEDEPIRVLKRIIYTRDRPSIRLSEANTQALFLHKSEEWTYEAEWRYLRYLSDADSTKTEQGQEIFLFNVPASCFARIIFGCRMRPEVKQQFNELLSLHPSLRHVKVYQASLDRERYQLRFEEMTL